MTPGLIRCSKHKDKLHAKLKINPLDETLKKIFTRYRNFYVDLLRKLKQKYESLALEQNKNCTKKLWKSIKTITYTDKTKEKSHALLHTNDSKENSLNHCNEYFSNVGKCLAEDILLQTNETQESLAAKVSLQNSPAQSLYLEPTDVLEINSLIMDLKTDSAPGLDGVTNRLLKAVKNHIITPLTAICNLSLSQGIFPTQWKTAAVTPVYKAGRKDDPQNYRPISLLGSFSKILEKLMNKRLVSFVESNKLISERQFGFRRNRSTEGAVSLLTGLISENLDKKKSLCRSIS